MDIPSPSLVGFWRRVSVLGLAQEPAAAVELVLAQEPAAAVELALELV